MKFLLFGIQEQIPRPGPEPPSLRPDQNIGTQPNPQPSGTAPKRSAQGGTEETILLVARSRLKSDNQVCVTISKWNSVLCHLRLACLNHRSFYS